MLGDDLIIPGNTMNRTHTEIMNSLKYGCHKGHGHEIVFTEIEKADIDYETKMKFRQVFIAVKDLADLERRFNELSESEQETLLEIIEKSWRGEVWHEMWRTIATEKSDEINARLNEIIGVTKGHQYIQFFNNADITQDRTIRLGVNWSACGTVNIKTAVEFAKAITEAAEFAANFKYNGMVEFY